MQGFQQQSERMICCRSTDVGESGYQVVVGWLMTTHHFKNPGHVRCCSAAQFQMLKTGMLKFRPIMLEVQYLMHDANLCSPV